MATLTFTLNSVQTGNLSKAYTISEADLTRWLASMGAPANIASAQALLNWANGTVAKIISDVQAYERSIPPPPITVG